MRCRSPASFVDQLLDGGEAKAKLIERPSEGVLSDLHRAASLCNEATFDPLSFDKPVEERATQGNPTDGAILKFAESAIPGASVRNAYPQVATIPFNSKNKFMVTLNEIKDFEGKEASYLAFVKGAPDVLLPKCTQYCSYADDQVHPLDEAAKTRFSELQTRLSRNAERVIMLCQRTYTPTIQLGSQGFEQDLLDRCLADLTIIGFVGIFDPPRPEAADTVIFFRFFCYGFNHPHYQRNTEAQSRTSPRHLRHSACRQLSVFQCCRSGALAIPV